VPGAFDQPEARIDAAPDQRVILRLRRNVSCQCRPRSPLRGYRATRAPHSSTATGCCAGPAARARRAARPSISRRKSRSICTRRIDCRRSPNLCRRNPRSATPFALVTTPISVRSRADCRARCTFTNKGRTAFREHDMTMQRLAQVVTAGAGTWLRPFLISLHESRRRQAAIERARYRHLIYEPETVISVGMSSPSQNTRRIAR
jgi:hypothetical protein